MIFKNIFLKRGFKCPFIKLIEKMRSKKPKFYVE